MSKLDKMGKLVLLRHGESVYNARNQFTGVADCELTEKGKKQAQWCSTWLEDMAFSQVFTSAQKRAHQTRDITLAALKLTNLPIHESPHLNERDYGKLTGMNKQEAAHTYGSAQVQNWRRDFHACPPGGETLAQTSQRAHSYYLQVIRPHLESGDNTLVVAHGNSIRGLLYAIMGLSEEAITQVEVGWCEPWVISFQAHKPCAIDIYLHQDKGKQSRIPKETLSLPIQMHTSPARETV